MQAKDIPEERIIALVKKMEPLRGWLTRWDAQAALPEFPPKVVSAKLNQMAKKGILSGCSVHHDCRGDFTLDRHEQK